MVRFSWGYCVLSGAKGLKKEVAQVEEEPPHGR